MIARYAGDCSECGTVIEKGEECDYDPAKKRIKHKACPLFEEDAAVIADRLGYRPHDKLQSELLGKARILFPLPEAD